MKQSIFIIIIFVLAFCFTDAHAKILNGKVLTVNKDFNFVIINLGKKDGIRKGMDFLVYRDKKLIGKVQVEETFSDMSSCVILPWVTSEVFKKDDGVMKP